MDCRYRRYNDNEDDNTGMYNGRKVQTMSKGDISYCYMQWDVG